MRSDPSPANRTTTIPPGSIPVTTPSPKAAWLTSSPRRNSGAGASSLRAAAQVVYAARAGPDPTPTRTWDSESVSSEGISSRKRERSPYVRAPKTLRVRA